MDRALRWLFWGFVLSCIDIQITFQPVIRETVVGGAVLLYGMSLARQARQSVPDRYLRRTQAACVAAMLLTLVPIGDGVFVLVACAARCEWLFLYLAESEALYGHDPAPLHAQRQRLRRLYLAQVVCIAASGLIVSLGGTLLRSLVPLLLGAAGLGVFAANAYQAYCMARLRKTSAAPPMLPPEDEMP